MLTPIADLESLEGQFLKPVIDESALVVNWLRPFTHISEDTSERGRITGQSLVDPVVRTHDSTQTRANHLGKGQDQGLNVCERCQLVLTELSAPILASCKTSSGMSSLMIWL